MTVGAERLVVHPVTGEVMDADAAGREWARLAAAVADARRELESLSAALNALDPLVRAACEEHGRIDGGDKWVVLIPPARRPAQRVDGDACRAHAEVLAAIGVGGYRTEYRPPTAAELRANAAAVIAAGIPLDTLLPPAPPPRMEVATAPKEAHHAR